ncbi:MAG TPA: flavin reductase [Hungateiclostridium thermocellum]|jgi:flavin reductase (DIM6/NTAB) family NADH-FMN oxidoreductase RutF/rubredoxin|uniref:Flavin reductase domain protein FMN-binding protein n=2 Tax=Acetivibrio thermocellus TaxID=1515 RepID=A3DK35_ACET2|nr:flavin reductase [Acetivibrio thermocellus]CDG37599.1 FMN-binding flavin reductase-like protein [Acetivibrio thermocellus BC1]ABN54314.1 flavin reductase domain protein FMN-binding protein [Acetivibrio thermocellus ATCC 27405]ADU73752.1 flavin reductase domain protein FMN-binding protein [Acetivibrio thermocellus DSM 1313]ALX07682.1 flavin reductase domain protein FMN-binding protein [Acetivibrio thermocellus AD2]ANV75424.1 flavin reductase domain protein FMN-binding protein [Acetivibrio th
MNQKALWNLSYGVYIVSVWDGERPTGCVVNSAMQITAEPATVAISVHHDNYTNGCIEKTGRFAITVLSEKTEPSIIGTFGFQTGKEINKFDSVKYDLKNDMPIVKDGCAYLVCEVINKMETSTHTVFLGKVLDADFISDEEPMTYSYYHKVIKGKSPKNAPTYIGVENETEENKLKEKRAKYVCSICGYEYTGDIPFEDLPEDYVCPVCGQPKSVFVKKE